MTNRERAEKVDQEIWANGNPIKILEAAFDEVQKEALEKAAKICDEQEEIYLKVDGNKPPELQNSADIGCQSCAYNIRECAKRSENERAIGHKIKR